MYEAGSLIFRIQSVGKAVLQGDLRDIDAAAAKTERTLDQTAKTTEKASTSQEGLGKQTRETSKSTRDAGKAHAEMAAQAERNRHSAKALKDELKQLSSEGKAAVREVGATMVGVGGAIVATTALTVKSAIGWESAWAGVTKTVEGTPRELQEVEDGLRDLTKVLPASHDEIAAVAEAAGQLGVKTKDVVSFTRTMIDLGETTNLTSDQAATSLAQLMNIMRTAPEDIGRLGATIVALGNDGASTEAEIVSMAQRIAGSGALVGATEGEVLALSNALASMGVTAELGGGVASRILQDLYSAVETGGESLQGFAKVAGMSSQEFATAFRNDPVRALDTFSKGLNQVEASGGNVIQTISDLGFKSTEEQRVLLQLKGAGDLLVDSLDLQATAWRENSALTDEAAKRYETVEAQISIMQNRFNEAAIDLGAVWLPLISDMVGGAADLASAFADLPEPVQGALSGATGLIGLATLAGGALLLAVPKAMEFRASLQTVRAEMPRTLAAGKSLAAFLGGPWSIALLAAVGGVGLLEDGLKSLRASSEEMQNSLKTASTAEEIFSRAAEGREFSTFRDMSNVIQEIPGHLDKVIAKEKNWFAVLGDKTMQERTNILNELGTELASLASTDVPAAQRSFRLLVDDMGLSEEQTRALLNQMPDYKNALTEQANALGINVTSSDELANSEKLLELAMGGATEAAAESVPTLDEVAGAAGDALEIVAGLSDELRNFGQVNYDVIEAESAFRAAIDDASAAMGEDGFKRSIDLATESGRANVDMLMDIASTTNEYAASAYDARGSVDELNGILEEGRQKLIDQALEFGATQEQAEDYADKLIAIPSDVSTRVDADTAAAEQAVADFQAQLDGLPLRRRVELVLETVPVPTPQRPGTAQFSDFIRQNGVKKEANGGRHGAAPQVYAYADGGGSREAQFRKAGSYVLWAEDETSPGEYFIPMAPSKRPRAVALASQMADEMGFMLVPRDSAQGSGGATPTSAAPAAGGISIGTIYTRDEDELVRRLRRLNEDESGRSRRLHGTGTTA